MTYSIDFRRKVLAIREQDQLSIAETARRFGVGSASITRWLKRLEPQAHRHKPATRVDRMALACDVRQHPDAYQRERAQRLSCSEKGIGHALRRMGISRKKNTAPS